METLVAPWRRRRLLASLRCARPGCSALVPVAAGYCGTRCTMADAWRRPETRRPVS